MTDIKLTAEQSRLYNEAVKNKEEIHIIIDPPKPEKWEPKGGDWYASGCSLKPHKGIPMEGYRLTGLERQTEEQAQDLARLLRITAIQHAYRCEFAPDYVVPPIGKDAFFIYLDDKGKARYANDYGARMIGVVYMPILIAQQFCDDFNAGRIDFGVEL